jgi:hypothetical protein
MPEGYEGVSQRDSRLGDQDTARRRGGAAEGLSASRESGRGRQADREGLGPVRRRRGGGPGGGPGGGGGPRGPRGRRGSGAPPRENAERPRADESTPRPEPQTEPQVENVDTPVAETTAPETTGPETTPPEQSGEETS